MKVIEHIGELATAHGTAAAAGDAQTVERRTDAYVAWEGDTIVSVGQGDYLGAAERLNAAGRLVTAGLVDCHTHLVFGGWREREFALKRKGVGYLDILKAGGGILSTVRDTRAASFDTLYQKAQALLFEMMRSGTTALEAKSGYGLDYETEYKQLAVAQKLRALNSDLVSTFLGAHAFAPEYTANAYVDALCDTILPRIAESGLATFCDVFCDEGVFSAEQAKRILLCGKAHGLTPKLHADEIRCIGGTDTARDVGAISCDHLSETGDAGIAALRAGGQIAVMLPATSFYLKKPYGRFPDMVRAGVPVAVATDFNPGSTPNLSLPFAMTVSCLYGGLTCEQALCGATLNGAAAIGLAERLGTVEAGKQADLVIWDADNLDQLLYRYGTNRAAAVIKKGTLWNN